MKRIIYKYPFGVCDFFQLSLPKGAEILSVQVQNETPCFWVLADPLEVQETRDFEILATGQPFDLTDQKFIGTFQLQGGSLIFHLFENRV